MVKILVAIILFLFLVFVESIFLKVFSFSIFVIVAVSLWKRVGLFPYFVLITMFGIILDSILNTPLGVHSLSICLLLFLVEFLYILIPRDSKFNYLIIFLFVFLYYILIPIGSSLFLSGRFPEISLNILGWGVLKSVISVGIFHLINIFMNSLRDGKGSKSIRLR